MENCDPVTMLMALNETESHVTPALTLQISRLAREVVDPSMVVLDISADVAGGPSIGSSRSTRQSIPLGVKMDIIHGKGVVIAPYSLNEHSYNSPTENLNQLKAALVIEDRGLGIFNNLKRAEVEILQRLKVTKPRDRAEFTSIFIDKLLNTTECFPLRIGIKLYLVVDDTYKDMVVLAKQLVIDNRLATVGDILDKCGIVDLEVASEIMCQGVCLDQTTPVYFLRECALQVDGFVHLVYRIKSK